MEGISPMVKAELLQDHSMAITFGADKEVSLQDLVKTVSHMISQLDPDAASGKTAKAEASVEKEVAKLENMGKPAIIMTSPIVRMYFKKLTEDYFKDLTVLSYNEVESNVELQSVGMVTI